VLGAGGTVGGAFHAGVLAALEEATGWDPRTAAVVVGTSAGSLAATGLRAGLSSADGLARALDQPLSPEGRRLFERSDTAPASPAGDAPRRMRSPGQVAATLGRVVTRPFAATPIAVLAGLLPDGTIATSAIADGVESVTEGRWPVDPLWICAVRQRDGCRVVFGRDDRPELPLAVAASCAIPGFFRPVEIGAERFLDGGAHSPTNADVLAEEELDLVVVVSPMSIAGRPVRLAVDQPGRWWARAQLVGEARRLRRVGTPVIAFQPTGEDALLMAGNALDPAKRAPVARGAHASTLRRIERPDTAERLRPLSGSG
jgi:NTE family protein